MRLLFQERYRNNESQLVSGERDRSLELSSVLTQVKDEKLGGVNGGGK